MGISKVRATAVLVTGLAVLGMGCSSDDDTTASDTTTTAAKSDECAALDQLKESTKDLASPSTLTGGKDTLDTALSKVKSDLDDLSKSVSADSKPEADAVKAAVDDLGTAVSKIGDGKLTDNLQEIGRAIAKVGSTTADLGQSLKRDC